MSEPNRHILMSGSDHAAKQMKACKPFGERWRAWCRLSLQLAEEAERASAGRVFSWEKLDEQKTKLVKGRYE